MDAIVGPLNEGVSTPPNQTLCVANLPLDEQIYLAFVDALGQDEDAAQDALDMVLPFLRKVWADGYLTGVLDERDHRDAPKVKTANPFGGSL